MVILVSEEDPRAKSSQGAQSKVREGSESRNCRDKGDGDCLGWERKSSSGEPDRHPSSLQLLWNSWTLVESQGNDCKKQPGPWAVPAEPQSGTDSCGHAPVLTLVQPLPAPSNAASLCLHQEGLRSLP